MRYERFEDLPVWKEAMQLGERIAILLEHRYFQTRRGLADQLDRAAVSVSNNIAEGFERGTTDTLINHIFIAKASAGETRSMLHGLSKRSTAPDSMISDFKFQISDLIKQSESICRQLQAWADYLQNTSIEGQRHQSDATRAAYDRRRRREAFLKKLKEISPRRDGAGNPIPDT
jgi:four helix bundle protein